MKKIFTIFISLILLFTASCSNAKDTSDSTTINTTNKELIGLRLDSYETINVSADFNLLDAFNPSSDAPVHAFLLYTDGTKSAISMSNYYIQASVNQSSYTQLNNVNQNILTIYNSLSGNTNTLSLMIINKTNISEIAIINLNLENIL